MKYYGMNLSKKMAEYNVNVGGQVETIDEADNSSEEVVCPLCYSKLEIKNGFYHCTNPKCEYEYKCEEKEEETDFWKLNMKSDANANGVGIAKSPEDIGLTQKQYNLAIAALLFYGFIINAVECVFLMRWAISISQSVLLIGYFASCMYGLSLMGKSNNPYVSFAGYNLVVLPVGLVLTRFVSHFDPYLVIDASCITAVFTLLMILVGTLFPKVFLDKGSTLMTALGIVVVVDLTYIFGFGFIDPDGLAIFASCVFSLYIAYDWARAQQIEYTLDNAIDVTVAMYLDIVNLFMRVLEILEKFKEK